ncbi:hypothetical protein KFL_006110080 [Klebsormidium nitens]|uniref:VWFA domain-containing protein n=1 Tax=Klebsormidium nitens TaxID=105231 RepID=A0A1Y1IN61_KLENI|nr:hypothetical protein KFL_006110080 [Klebsormidium nitens]|eukprot:GAQ90196.1 hypothetical protein KFL_006110080 [Klebsormidium nitens]
MGGGQGRKDCSLKEWLGRLGLEDTVSLLENGGYDVNNRFDVKLEAAGLGTLQQIEGLAREEAEHIRQHFEGEIKEIEEAVQEPDMESSIPLGSRKRLLRRAYQDPGTPSASFWDGPFGSRLPPALRKICDEHGFEEAEDLYTLTEEELQDPSFGLKVASRNKLLNALQEAAKVLDCGVDAESGLEGATALDETTGLMQPKAYRRFQLMALDNDHQNDRLVEKIVLPRREIVELCNDVFPASCRGNASKLQFDKLDTISHECYGLFGQKLPMLKLLARLGAISSTEASTNHQSWNDLAPGMYAITVQGHYPSDAGSGLAGSLRRTFVVYWPQDDRFLSVQATDQTTTFLRYLTQLCEHVFVCMDQNAALAFPKDRIEKESQRILEISIDKTTVQEEKFELRGGVTFNTGSKFSASASEGNRPTIHLLAGGGSRAAILLGKELPPQRGWNSQWTKRFQTGGAEVMLQNLQQKYSVYLAGEMADEEKLLLLEHHSSDCRQEIYSEEFESRFSPPAGKDGAGTAAAPSSEELRPVDGAGDAGGAKVTGDFRGKAPVDDEVMTDAEEQGAPSQAIDEGTGADNTEAREADESEGTVFELQRRHRDLGIDADLEPSLLSRQAMKTRLATCLAVLILTPKAPKSESIAQLLRTEEGATLNKNSRGIISLSSLPWKRELAEACQEIVLNIPATLRSGAAAGGYRKSAWKGSSSETNRRKKVETDRINNEYEALKGERRRFMLARIERAVFPTVTSGEAQKLALKLRRFIRKGDYVTMLGDLEESEEACTAYALEELCISKKNDEKLQGDPFSVVSPETSRPVRFDIASAQQIVQVFLVRGTRFIVVGNDPATGKAVLSLYCLAESSQPYACPRFGKAASLAAFDEQTRLLALYSFEEDAAAYEPADVREADRPGARTSTVRRSELAVYRFDERYQRYDRAAPVVDLTLLSGDPELKQLTFLHSRRKLAFLDAGNRLRIYDVQQGCALNCNLQLRPAEPVCRLLSSERGQCVFAVEQPDSEGLCRVYPFMTSSLERDSTGQGSDQGLSPVSLKVGGAFDVVSFGLGSQVRQGQLAVLEKSTGLVKVMALHVTAKEEACMMRDVLDQPSRRMPAETVQLTVLEYLYYVYAKFAAKGVISNDEESVALRLTVLFDCSETIFWNMDLSRRVQQYVDTVERLLSRTEKRTEVLRLKERLQVGSLQAGWSRAQAIPSEDWALEPRLASLGLAEEIAAEEGFGTWVRRLICLVPIQIARAEDNSFQVLLDGVSMTGDHARSVGTCAEGIRFGLYDAILDWWRGPIRIVSSMGKQSTGKSYTLNHLFGLSFEISGARCTDGCWLTLSIIRGVMYLVLDFEGLGSFERTDQEDMLLSVFNAAISNLTIFKTEYRLDRDVENMFARFQTGVNLLKGDARLFRGQFLIAIKDVLALDVDKVRHEFRSKISRIVSGTDSDNTDNFIPRMYGGKVVILPFPPLGDPAYYSELESVQRVLEGRPGQFESGPELATFMKTLMAKLHLKDWVAMDQEQLEARVRFLSKYLEPALAFGRLSREEYAEEEEELRDLSTR